MYQACGGYGGTVLSEDDDTLPCGHVKTYVLNVAGFAYCV